MMEKVFHDFNLIHKDTDLVSIVKLLTFSYLFPIIVCDDGTYGYDCMNNCSGHCLNNFLCNKQTGHCEQGCNPGYTGNDCSKGKQ